MESIFSRLSKYRPREKRIPEEDFFTEVFCAVLNKEKELAKILIGKLAGFWLKEIEIETQFSIGTGLRPDMVVRGICERTEKEVQVFIENKIASLEGEDQLISYSSHLQNSSKGNDVGLLYITKYEASPEGIIEEYRKKSKHNENEIKNLEKMLKATTWFNVYSQIKPYVATSQLCSEYVNDFLKLMEDKGMDNSLTLGDFALVERAANEKMKIDSLFNSAIGGFVKYKKDRVQGRVDPLFIEKHVITKVPNKFTPYAGVMCRFDYKDICEKNQNFDMPYPIVVVFIKAGAESDLTLLKQDAEWKVLIDHLVKIGWQKDLNVGEGWGKLTCFKFVSLKLNLGNNLYLDLGQNIGNAFDELQAAIDGINGT